jgi:phage replication-related protein YjqB (UPF0714/DUF867 family)
MKDKFKSFAELESRRSNSFEIESKKGLENILIFTPHGGGIEPGTTEICRWFSKNSFSYYSFTGTGKNCKDLHITSTRFVEPRLVRMLRRHRRAISFHGMTDKMRKEFGADIFLGGLDKRLIKSLKRSLENSGFSVATRIEFPDSNLAALTSNNVTNLCRSGRGVQIELSEHLRKRFFKGDYKRVVGRSRATEVFLLFCETIRNSLLSL